MACAAKALETLAAPTERAVDGLGRRRRMPTTRPTTWRRAVRAAGPGGGHEDACSACAPADTVYTNGAGNYSGWLHRYCRYLGLQHHGRTQLAPTSGAMGYGVPAAVAAALLHPRAHGGQRGRRRRLPDDRPGTGHRHRLRRRARRGKLVSIVVDNGSYGTIRMHQEREYPGRVSGSDLYNPDFAALARAYGWRARARRRHRRVRAGLRRRAGRRPADAAPPQARPRRDHHAHHAECHCARRRCAAAGDQCMSWIISRTRG